MNKVYTNLSLLEEITCSCYNSEVFIYEQSKIKTKLAVSYGRQSGPASPKSKRRVRRCVWLTSNTRSTASWYKLEDDRWTPTTTNYARRPYHWDTSMHWLLTRYTYQTRDSSRTLPVRLLPTTPNGGIKIFASHGKEKGWVGGASSSGCLMGFMTIYFAIWFWDLLATNWGSKSNDPNLRCSRLSLFKPISGIDLA